MSKNKILLAGILGLASMGASLGAVDSTDLCFPSNSSPKKQKKCLLPTCNIMTRHNGGYCCAEHCQEHRLLLKNKQV